MHTRAHEEGGFGLVELVMAVVMLNVGILAIVAAFTSGNVALGRASQLATASAVAEKQMEIYRGLLYTDISFSTTEWTAAIGDSTYTADTVYVQHMASPSLPEALVATIPSCPYTPPAPPPQPSYPCDPSYTLTGADSRLYRVDTYLYYGEPSGGEGTELKKVTVVVRPANNLSRSLARVSSEFDPSTGSQTTGA